MAPKVPNFSCVFLLFLILPLLSHAHFSDSKDEETSSSPFAFIKHFHGLSKGDKAIGLHELKKYLQHFGYLTYPNFENQNDDYFDHLLESAIKTYQLNYRLNITGMLDDSTVSTMMMPRCGVPDIINGTNWMQLAAQAGSSHYAFMDGNPRWHKFRLTYALGRMRKDAARSIRQAFSKWAAVSRFRFKISQDFRGADLKISFEGGDHGDGSSFDGLGGVLAHAFPPPDGRLHFDAAEHWAVGAVPGAFDIGTIGLHEIGHLLGLGHSSVRNAIMFPTISAGEKKGLRSDDIQGIKALYH